VDTKLSIALFVDADVDVDGFEPRNFRNKWKEAIQ
jgi:hypothetical protein